MISLPNDPDLDLALAERAIARTMRGTAISGGALGVLALAFLVVAGGALNAQSVPQLVILGLGWLAGIFVPGYCALLQRRLRAGPVTPLAACLALDGLLRRAAIALPVAALLAGASVVALMLPRDTSLLSSIVSLAILSQLVVVLITLRSGVRRATWRLAETDFPAP